MLIYDPPTPSKVTKFIANLIWFGLIFFVTFVLAIIFAPAVLSTVGD